MRFKRFRWPGMHKERIRRPRFDSSPYQLKNGKPLVRGRWPRLQEQAHHLSPEGHVSYAQHRDVSMSALSWHAVPCWYLGTNESRTTVQLQLLILPAMALFFGHHSAYTSIHRLVREYGVDLLQTICPHDPAVTRALSVISLLSSARALCNKAAIKRNLHSCQPLGLVIAGLGWRPREGETGRVRMWHHGELAPTGGDDVIGCQE
ncbi:hypothetical protein V8C35DRAFT_186964 [Trichoderma chlorosporum]